MASLAKDRRLQFPAPDGKRKTIRLGSKMPMKQARGIQRHVERLNACQLDGSAPPEETSRWVAGISTTPRDKLVRVGLLQQEEAAIGYTLGELLDDYKGRPKWGGFKPKTRQNKQRCLGYAIDYFDQKQPIRRITTADAEDFYDNLLLAKSEGGKGYAVATCNLTAATIHAVFQYAIQAERLDRNPFSVLPRVSRKGKNATVSAEDSKLVLESMAGTEGKLLFALARWGGLRVPSEPLHLRWCDIDWENDRFRVHSPKTERYEGREMRWVPIFPELALLFDARFSDAADGDEYVLPILQDESEQKATRMLKTALRLSGVEQWPRLWHSLRSTRQTELEVAVRNRDLVCDWFGNSPSVAKKHYINFTDEHFAEAAQKAAQHTSTQSGTEVKTKGAKR